MDFWKICALKKFVGILLLLQRTSHPPVDAALQETLNLIVEFKMN
jgi:hypothetical protein